MENVVRGRSFVFAPFTAYELGQVKTGIFSAFNLF